MSLRISQTARAAARPVRTSCTRWSTSTARTRMRHRHPERRPGENQAGRPGGLRPERLWEVIALPGGGRYVARRAPRVELLLPGDLDGAQADGAGAVLVLDTHDVDLAAQVAWPAWSARCPGQPLPAPRIGWWRPLPAHKALAGTGVERMWWPARPGGPGAVPGTEFAVAGGGR